MSKRREHVAYRHAAAAESADRPPLEAQNTEGFAQNSEQPPPHLRARRRIARNRHADRAFGGQALVSCRVARGNSPCLANRQRRFGVLPARLALQNGKLALQLSTSRK
jgi:hypothetical protein